LEEEIKKDLKEIKKEIETQEKSTEESEKKKSKTETEIKKSLEEEKSDITPEKAEGLVEKLIKSEEEEKVFEEKIPKKFRTKDLFFIFGSIFTIVFIIIGIWISLKLIKGDFSKKNINSLSKPEVLIPESTVFKKLSKIVILKDEEEADYPYKLKIKNFLIPIGFEEFLRLNITLYFDQNTSTEELTEKEFDFRKILYNYFKNTPIDVWKNTKNIYTLEEKIKERLKEKKIKPLPQKIKLEGVILKG